MRKYKVLNRNNYESGEYKIIPLRSEDRYDIMKWRNEQIYHLRQNSPLKKEEQDFYFDHVVSELFEQDQPNQMLFSYLKNNECIGYGGLVHINWIDKNAEVSFIMNTDLEVNSFDLHWTNFLEMLETLAFEELKFHKLYIYAFDLRPHLYQCLTKNNYFKDAVLAEHCYYNEQFLDVVIHSKLNAV